MFYFKQFQKTVETIQKMCKHRNYENFRKSKPVKVEKMNIPIYCADYMNPRNQNKENIRFYLVPFDFQKNSASLGKSNIEQIVEKAKKTDHLIFITSSKLSVAGVSLLKHRLASKKICYWEHFFYNRLSFDIYENVHSATKYTLLKEDELQALEQKYQIKRDQFPCMIAKEDAMASYMDFRKGDFIQIEYRSSIVFRKVIHRFEKD